MTTLMPSRILQASSKVVLCGLLFAMGVAAQADEAGAKKKPDPEVAAQLKMFKSALSEKDFTGDERAIEIIDRLLPAAAEMHPKDRQNFIKTLHTVFRGRKRDPGEPALYKATVVALGSLGPESGRTLKNIYEKAPFGTKPRDWVTMRELVLENLGKASDEKQAKFLLDEATRGHEDRIKAAAGKALGNYEESDFAFRRDLVKKLLVDYGRIEGDTKSNQLEDPNVITRKRTLAAISDPWNEALARLTGQRFRTAEEWTHWFNKNKTDKESWSKGA